MKSIETSVGISVKVASCAGVVPSRGECAIAPVAHIPISPASSIFFISFPVFLCCRASVDPVCKLQFPNAGGDHRYICPCDTLQRWHIPKRPVMPTDAHCNRTLETFIAVVAWFINDVDQWRCHTVLTCCIHTMENRTLSLKTKLPDLGIPRQRFGNKHLGEKTVLQGDGCIGLCCLQYRRSQYVPNATSNQNGHNSDD